MQTIFYTILTIGWLLAGYICASFVLGTLYSRIRLSSNFEISVLKEDLILCLFFVYLGPMGFVVVKDMKKHLGNIFWMAPLSEMHLAHFRITKQ